MTHVLHRHPFTPYDQLPAVDVASFRALPMPDSMLPAEMTNDFLHRVGTRPLEVAQWLPSDRETEPTIAMKRELLRTRRSEVVGLLEGGEGGEDAADEAAQLVAAFAGKKLESTGIDALVEAALMVADDLVVMKSVVVAGVVCSPSRWRLNSKLGQDMLAVHRPVAKYAEQVGGAVDTTMARLKADKPMIRSNWTIEDHCSMFQPVGPNAPLVSDPSQLWVRMERQTLRALPLCGGSMFTIRTYQQPITEYVARGADKARTLQTLIKRLPDDVAQYKSLLHYRESLLAWLESYC
jgi:hypothetical protein